MPVPGIRNFLCVPLRPLLLPTFHILIFIAFTIAVLLFIVIILYERTVIFCCGTNIGKMQKSVRLLSNIDKSRLEPFNNLVHPAKIYIAYAAETVRTFNHEFRQAALFNQSHLDLVTGLVHQQLLFHSLLHYKTSKAKMLYPIPQDILWAPLLICCAP